MLASEFPPRDESRHQEMISKIRIRNFQSLRSIDLEPGKFTVVVGATGSGKSSLVRALRLLFFNARGTSWMSRGSSSASVSASLPEADIMITRGKGKDSYQVHTGDPDDAPYVMTKLAGGVPDQIREILRVQEDESGACLNFAGQFDVPYLLGSSGAQVARILGDLTNVTVLYSAARESSRRRLDKAGALRVAEEEIAHLRSQAQSFAGLRIQQTVLEAVRAAVEVIETDRASSAVLGEVLGELSEL